MKASAPKNANAPARQSASFHPPKSSAVATTPNNNAVTIAVSSSAIQPRARPSGTILARRKAMAPEASQTTIPIARLSPPAWRLSC